MILSNVLILYYQDLFITVSGSRICYSHYICLARWP